MYTPSKLKHSITASSIREVEAELIELKNILNPNDEIRIVLKGPRTLEIISMLPELLRQHDYGLVWAEENIEDTTITAYARYKTTSPTKMRLREGLRKHEHDHDHGHHAHVHEHK